METGITGSMGTQATLMREVAEPSSPRAPFLFSLRWKVALSFSLLLVLVTGAVALALVRYESIFLTREGQKRARSLAENLAVNARDPILSLDDLRLGPITESVMLDGDVRYAFLLDHQGKVLYHSNPDRVGTVFAQEVPDPEEGVLQEAAPITVEGVRVGTAVVGLGEDHIRHAMRATVIGLLLPLTLGAMGGVLGVFWLTGIHVRRIETLEGAVQALGSGNLYIQVDETGRDEVSRLTRHFNRMVGQLNQTRRRVLKNFTETVSALAAAVEAKDAYTRGHCERVARISEAIAKRVGVNDSVHRDLRLAAVLHDIGKIGVEGDIIGKLGPLDSGEIHDMRHHPVIGARILSPLSSLGRVSLYVKHHHEHFDGSGYPSGLKGDAIPLASRIIHLVDAYDAMTSNRPYRRALGKKEALDRIRDGQGKQFDPVLVAVFIELEREGIIEAICHQVEGSEA